MLMSRNVRRQLYKSSERLAGALNREGAVPEDVNYALGAHPEGVKRGGTAPVYTGTDGARVFYDHVDGQWYPYDDEE